jgi:predicted porin
MNKKLVAVAVAGLLVAPLAQAQTANVTLYGRMNLDMEVVNANGDKSRGGVDNNIYRVSSNSSRFGVRGTEALGGGLSAIFQIENSVNGDSGGGVIAARESFVGLQGAWGTFKMGNFLSPYDDITSIFASVPTLNTGIMAAQAIWGQATQSNANGGFDNRNPNSVRYDTPVMAGFNGSIQYSSTGNSPAALVNTLPGAVEGVPRSNSGIWVLGGFYNNGPAQLGVAYAQNNSVRGVGLTDSAFSIAGGWQFSGWKIVGVWERLSYDVTTSTDLDRDFWSIGTTINIGPGQMYASYGQADDGKGSAATGARVGNVIKGNDTGAYMWTVSYTYPLSKRTLLYTAYVKVGNDSNGVYNYSNGPAGVTSGANPGGFAMGMVNFF